MDYELENHTVIEKETYCALHEKACKRLQRPMRLLMLALAVWFLVLGATNIFGPSKQTWDGTLWMVIGVLALLAWYKGYYIFSLRAWKAQKNSIPRDGFDWLISSEQMQRVSKDSKMTLRYAQVNHVVETADMFGLISGNGVFPVSKNGFTKGDAEQFRALLREKCPKACR